jgi:hypothetical protein
MEFDVQIRIAFPSADSLPYSVPLKLVVHCATVTLSDVPKEERENIKESERKGGKRNKEGK